MQLPRSRLLIVPARWALSQWQLGSAYFGTLSGVDVSCEGYTHAPRHVAMIVQSNETSLRCQIFFLAQKFG